VSVPIITRKQWGATPWRSPIYRVAMSEKDNFLVHYHGGKPAAQRGVYVARNVEKIHLDNGWAGVGYNFMVDMDGKVYEGRGWDGVGSQCPGFNRSGVGVYVAVGGDQVPTPEALRSVVALRDEVVRRRGGAGVREMGHKDGIATSCPGTYLYRWVHDGMQVSGYTGGGGMTAPTPKPPAAPKPSTSSALVVDGKLGPNTIKRWQKVMGTPQDGVISRPSTLVKAVQRRLNTKGAGLVVDGKGIGRNDDGDYGPTKTVKALQRYLGTTADGVLSHPSSNAVKALQRRLNTGKF
jgi:hypothetical protein